MQILKKITLLTFREKLLLAALLVTAAVAHGYNMFHFPYYENDEGVYMSQAWSLLKFGKLAPYTYWYDHAPGGWILIALWTFLTGGFFTFGFSINTGRVLMLVLHVFSSIFLYFIMRKLTKSSLASATAVIIFSLSPLGIYYQRRVLLDNIIVFWMLLSLVFAFYYQHKLRYIFLSGVAFGIAVLSKETAIFLLPVYIYIIYAVSHSHHKRFAVIQWISVFSMTVSLYLLYALLKGEFFPYGTPLGGEYPHVSLIDALKFQTSRKGGSIFDFENSSFWYGMRMWLSEDPVVIYLGAVATVLNILIGIKNFAARVAGWLSVFFWIFLMRGGLVIEFYITPIIPLLAMNIALFGWYMQQLLDRLSYVRVLKHIPSLALCSGIIITSFYYATNIRDSLNLYTSDQVTPQVKAVDWILARETPGTFMIIDNYGYIDLQERKKDTSFKTEWYWKVDKDPDVREDMINSDENNVDYVALTPQMKNDIAYSGLGMTLAAWKNSRPITIFSNDYWDVDVWGSMNPERILKASWESYKKDFIKQGRVIDPYQNDITTSEGQSYALLRAVWMNDKKTFDDVYGWTKLYLRQPTGIYYWKWEGSTDSGKVIDQGNATDADQDIVLALLFAQKKWKDETYKDDAMETLQAIWSNNIVRFNNNYYVSAGNWGNMKAEIVINPSYLSPASYRIFAEVDRSRNWNALVESSYEVLQGCTAAKLDQNTGILPPEWCAFDKKTRTFRQVKAADAKATEYGYNAFRVPWRVALDYIWNKEKKAKEYLASLNHLQEEYKTKKKIAASYKHNGEVWEDYESVAAYGGNIGYFMIHDSKHADHIFKEKLLKKFYEDRERSYWDDPKNYYTQNWGWFGTALYSKQLPNLWGNTASSTQKTNRE